MSVVGRSPPNASVVSNSKNNGTVDNESNPDFRCVQCEAVVNELLTFISNKVDTLPETGIIQICLSSYTTEEIETARSIAYTMMAPHKRMTRRKEGLEQKSVQEIIKLIKECNSLPNFVAKNLNKLPAVSFDYIDITSFLKEMALLKNDVASIKAKTPPASDNPSLTSDIESVKKEVLQLKDMIAELQRNRYIHMTGNDNPTSSLRPYRKDKDTRNDLHYKVYSTESMNSDESEGTFRSAAQLPAQAAEITMRASVRAERGGRGGGCESQQAQDLTYAHVCTPSASTSLQKLQPFTHAQGVTEMQKASVISSNKQLTSNNDKLTVHTPSYRDIALVQNDDQTSDGFKTVRYKKKYNYRFRNTRGTSQNTSKLQVVESFGYIYLSRIKKHITVENIIEYIKERQEDCQNVELLMQKKETSFNSFKITVVMSKLNTFLQNDFWPQGLVFRRFRQPRPVKDTTEALRKSI